MALQLLYIGPGVRPPRYSSLLGSHIEDQKGHRAAIYVLYNPIPFPCNWNEDLALDLVAWCPYHFPDVGPDHTDPKS